MCQLYLNFLNITIQKKQVYFKKFCNFNFETIKRRICFKYLFFTFFKTLQNFVFFTSHTLLYQDIPPFFFPSENSVVASV